jgi:hypothetical protein
MTVAVLRVADVVVTALHVAVIAAFVTLWIPRRTVRLHRWLVVGVAASWLGLGPFKGFGYCFLTDLGWWVKRELGERGLPGSFVKYAVDAVTGLDVPPSWTDAGAAGVFVAGILVASYRFVEEKHLQT